MKTKNSSPTSTQTSSPSSSVSTAAPRPAAAPRPGCFLGLDLGDRKHHLCVLGASGEVLHEGSLANARPALAELLVDFPGATIAMEAGTHSPWISRFLMEQGARVLVANPRKLHAISRHERKCDRRDAQMPSTYRSGRVAELESLMVRTHSL